MASFYYNYQNPSGFRFLILIRAINCSLPSTGITKFELEKGNKMNSHGNCSKIMPS